MARAAISWSGGKHSCAALHRAVPLFEVVAMITMFDEQGALSRSHGSLTPGGNDSVPEAWQKLRGV